MEWMLSRFTCSLLIGMATLLGCYFVIRPIGKKLVPLSDRESLPRQLQIITDRLYHKTVHGGASRNKIGLLLNSTYLSSINYEHHPTMNVTSEFHRVLEDVKSGRHVLPSHAAKYVYVLVPGLFTSFFPGYFKKIVKVFNQRNLSIEVIPLKDMSVATSAKNIRRYILDTLAEKYPQKQIVLIGHSKGAVDSTAALTLYPELRRHVKALISVQGPIAGAAFANDIGQHYITKDLLSVLIENVLDGHPDALLDMGYENRHNFLKQNPYPACSGCEADCRGVRTLTFASSSLSPISTMASAIQYVKIRYSECSDGLVTTKDMIIPGSRAIYVENVDHAATGFEFFPNTSSNDPGELVVTLVSLALEDNDLMCSQIFDPSQIVLRG